jgi:hypothetical protein
MTPPVSQSQQGLAKSKAPPSLEVNAVGHGMPGELSGELYSNNFALDIVTAQS